MFKGKFSFLAFNNLSHQKVAVLLSLIFLLAVFVRTYNFSEWLLFRGDQARDAQIVREAYEQGAGKLPLLGPRAMLDKKGEILRLGPAYYYLLYLSAEIFRSTSPVVMALPDLFFSLLAIPLLYLFLRQFFQPTYSLALTALYGFSFFAIYTSRFAWNPNSVTFFSLLNLYSLLRFANESRYKQKLIWLTSSVLALAIASQLHYFAFFTLLGTNGLFIFFHSHLWNYQSWEVKKFFNRYLVGYILVVVSVVSLIYTPVIANELLSHGQNTRQFIHAFTAKPKKGTVIKKAENSLTKITEQASFSFSGLTPDKKPPFYVYLFGMIIWLGVFLLPKYFFAEKETSKKNFIALTLGALITFLIISFPFSLQLQPRYFMPINQFFFVLVGFWLIFMGEFLKNQWKSLALGFVVITVFFINTYHTLAWFSQQKNHSAKDTRLLKAEDNVRWGEMQKIADYIVRNNSKDSPIIYLSDSLYLNSFRYLLNQNKLANNQVFFLRRVYNIESFNTFFVVAKTSKGLNGIPSLYKDKATLVDKLSLDVLTVYKFQIDPAKSKQFIKKKKFKDTDERLYWNDLK